MEYKKDFRLFMVSFNRYWDEEEKSLLEEAARKSQNTEEINRTTVDWFFLAIYSFVLKQYKQSIYYLNYIINSQDEDNAIIVSALFKKGVVFEAQGRTEEAIALYSEIDRQFGHEDELPLQEQIARILINKGILLEKQGKLEDAIATYEEVDLRFGNSGEPSLDEWVIMATFR